MHVWQLYTGVAKRIVPTGDRVIEADDEVFFVAARKDIRNVMAEMRKLDKPFRRIMLAGGGNIGKRLAESLEARYQVKLLDRSASRANYLARELGAVDCVAG